VLSTKNPSGLCISFISITVLCSIFSNLICPFSSVVNVWSFSPIFILKIAFGNGRLFSSFTFSRANSPRVLISNFTLC
jgi:hypothetical protein